MKFSPSRFAQPRLAASNAAPSADARQAERFRAIVLPHLDGAYNLARYLTRDPTLSEDVVQDAFVRAYRAFGDFRGGSAKAWLFAIVRNCSHSATAAQSAAAVRTIQETALSENQAEQVDSHTDEGADPEQQLIAREDAAEARSLIEALPEPFREAIVLRELEELSYKEIAEVTGVAIGTVMSRLSRARAILCEVAMRRGSEPDQSRSSR